ncbi:MAG: 1-acyl-sn-glycerol-3-phosphate acyltransferase [Myxococcales bacterium]|nr:1-acyl-sn-glycerol-3-phosphate acyltransferase [Myxococcales bacterium]
MVRYLLIGVYTIFWATLAMCAAVLDRSGYGVIWIVRTWVRWIFKSCGIEVRTDGTEHIDPACSYVIMCNHQSVIDIGALVTSLPLNWRFVAKRELTRVPFFGWALGMSDHIIIDRGNRERAVESLKLAAKRIRSGVNVVIFPEGTRSEDGSLRPFKSGGFHLALEAGVPILPVTVSGSQQITPKGSLRVESGVVAARFGAPIPTEGLSVGDRNVLKARVREAILAGFDEALQHPKRGGGCG